MYGFGWTVADDLISHSWSMYYSNSVIATFPKEKIGIALLSNERTYGTAYINALTIKLKDLLNGKFTDPWPEWKKLLMPQPPFPNPPKHITPSKILSTYLGIYSHLFFCKITITPE